MSKKNVFGFGDNTTSVLCYALIWVSGLFFLIMEKENKTIRFHALQSTVWFGLLSVLNFVLMLFSNIFLIGFFINIITGLITLVLGASWVFLMVMAFSGRIFKLPIIGDVVWAQVHKS